MPRFYAYRKFRDPKGIEWCLWDFFMHTGTQRKHVIKPINRFADGCPTQRVVEKVVPLLEITRAPGKSMSAEADGADCEGEMFMVQSRRIGLKNDMSREVTWNNKDCMRKRKRRNERNEKYSDRHGGSQGPL